MLLAAKASIIVVTVTKRPYLNIVIIKNDFEHLFDPGLDSRISPSN